MFSPRAAELVDQSDPNGSLPWVARSIVGIGAAAVDSVFRCLGDIVAAVRAVFDDLDG